MKPFERIERRFGNVELYNLRSDVREFLRKEIGSWVNRVYLSEGSPLLTMVLLKFKDDQ